jgi:hypothetical protein
MAVSALGTLLKIGDGGGPETFTTIAEVRDISGPGFSLGTEEVSSHDSALWRTFIPTFKEGGEVTFDVNFTAHATQGFTGGLYNDFANRTLRNFQLVLTTSPAKTASFAAYVAGFELGMPVEGVLSASVTLQLSGATTWA